MANHLNFRQLTSIWMCACACAFVFWASRQSEILSWLRWFCTVCCIINKTKLFDIITLATCFLWGAWNSRPFIRSKLTANNAQHIFFLLFFPAHILWHFNHLHAKKENVEQRLTDSLPMTSTNEVTRNGVV